MQKLHLHIKTVKMKSRRCFSFGNMDIFYCICCLGCIISEYSENNQTSPLCSPSNMVQSGMYQLQNTQDDPYFLFDGVAF